MPQNLHVPPEMRLLQRSMMPLAARVSCLLAPELPKRPFRQRIRLAPVVG
jgi:hypothetical protein